uniref:virulence-associated E family protein n=1 Tax=Ndongobacter massiliensis TaxID=1871025 RepID=UPI000931F57A|nr:virulence-associated E family protein [Ndongobacter massiliensis]
MRYDRKITISVGSSRKSINWQRQEMNYSDFLEKFKIPTRSVETLDAYLKLSKAQQDDLKDVGGFVGGALKGRRRKADNVLFRDLVTLDFDNIASGMTDEVIRRVMLLGCSYLIYSTRKHAPYKPRLRVVFPTDRAMLVDEYEPIARKMAEMIGIEMADPTTFEPSRLMYWPSCSSDSTYIFKSEDKPFLSADGVLKMYADWTDVSSWPQVPGQEVKHRQLITRQKDPTTKPGLIGAFCRVYDIYRAMATYLPQAYDDTADPNRFTYAGGSTTGGAIVYEDGKFLYSHHATDPCGGQLVNAWDLVRLHKFSHLDEEAKPDTPTATLPSTKAMRELAQADKDVVALVAKEHQDEAASYFDDIYGKEAGDEEQADDGEWMKMLTPARTGEGYEKSIANIVTILTYEPNLGGKLYMDAFANRGMVDLPLPWDNGEGSRMWSDTDDAQLTLWLEKKYDITGREKIENAIKVVGYNNRRNKVREFMRSCRWDGKERIKTLLRDYLGCEENIYTEEIMKKALVAAIARATSDVGVKYDNMIVFKGPQGIGKSTFLAKLGGEWFNDSLYSFEGKEAAELIQGTLLVEVGELSALTKSETEVVKQFLSKTHDIYREAYGKRTNKYPRRCVFFGSTNSEEFLKDVTGNRRFWPVSCHELPVKKDIWKDFTEEEIRQVWGEAYFYYQIGENLCLSEEAEEIAKAMQETFREVDPKEGEIRAFLEKKIPKNWYEMNLANQRSFLNGSFQGVEEADLVERDKVCLAEIWQLCFGGDMKYLRRRDSNELANVMTAMRGWKRNKGRRRYGAYGQQRGYERTNILSFVEAKKSRHA